MWKRLADEIKQVSTVTNDVFARANKSEGACSTKRDSVCDCVLSLSPLTSPSPPHTHTPTPLHPFSTTQKTCVFFPDGSPLFGKHCQPCKCGELYGTDSHGRVPLYVELANSAGVWHGVCGSLFRGTSGEQTKWTQHITAGGDAWGGSGIMGQINQPTKWAGGRAGGRGQEIHSLVPSHATTCHIGTNTPHVLSERATVRLRPRRKN